MKKVPMDNSRDVLKELKQKADKDKSKILSRFFKTGHGEYGEGDKFLGITVPVSRTIAQKYGGLSFLEISKLLQSEYHEVRLVALHILVHQYNQHKKLSTVSLRQGLGNKASKNIKCQDNFPYPGGTEHVEKKKIVEFYLKHIKYINNWDLVDSSASYIVGDYLFENGDRKILEKLAISKDLWERRIAIISTFAFIYKGETKWTKKIVKMLMKDKHDLIHKACGWMLREMGKRVSEPELILFLNTYTRQMPRTMLRYAIERLPESKRQYYLNL